MAVAFKDDYVKMDQDYEGKTYLMSANTLLTWPADIDASRLCMNTSETKQCLTLLNPDVPRLSTGWENVLGRRNKQKSYFQLDGNWEVVDIIKKFKTGMIYTLVVYNAELGMWDMIEKPIAENLTERFGYVFNTEYMDSLKIGDKISNAILYKSTSYDENMNYRYGKNANVLYTTSTDTFEDAVKIRQGWADQVESVEIDTVWASVNVNHVPLNLYGDAEHEYKVVPDFGEPIQNSCIFALRPINNDHILVDMQNEALKKVMPTDIDYYISESKNSYIYDMNIYFNNISADVFPDNIFFHQLKGYYDECCEYADRMSEFATNIKNTGDKYTHNISFFKSKYQHWNDPEWLWCGKEKNKPFGFITIEFKVRSDLGLPLGSKAAGRYGDKGVISSIASDPDSEKRAFSISTMDCLLDMLNRPINDEEREKLAAQIQIVPDSEMPYTDDFPVDILLNASGAVRRLNPGQIDEVDINFQAEQVRKRVCSLKTLEEKENLIFEFLGMLNEAECTFFYDMYQSFTQHIDINGFKVALCDQKAKEDFIHDVEENGFYIVKAQDSPIRYEAIKKIYEKYDWIKPLPLYIDIFGTKKRRIIKDGIVGQKYMMILKHNSNKNFSARSTYRVNRADLPVKDTTKKDNRSQYSKSPVRIGESYNLMSSISGRLLAEWNIFMRSSTLGRNSLKRIIETDNNPLEIKRLKVKDNYVNANADILNAKLKTMGIKITFIKEGDDVDTIINDAIMPLKFGKYTVYDSPLRKSMYNKLFLKFLEVMESVSFVETYPGEKDEYAWKKVFEQDDIKELDIPSEIKEMLVKTTQSKGEELTTVEAYSEES